MDRAKAEEMVEKSIKNGGGTFTNMGDDLAPVVGFAVGRLDETYASTSLVEVAVQAVEIVSKLYPSSYIGIWIDDDRFYIDPVAIVLDYNEAVVMGRRNRQTGIYDFSTGRTILL